MKKFIAILLVAFLFTSCAKPLGCAPEVGTVPDLDAPVSSEVKG